MRSTHSLLGSMAVLCLLATGAPTARAQQESVPQRPAFRSDVDLVLHAVAVLDADGQPVSGLTTDDFRVYEDDERQRITHFLAPDATPLDVALVMDSSASLAHWARAVRTSAKTFLTTLEVLDCVYLLPFNDEVGPGHWARAMDPALSYRIDGIFMEGRTVLYDAVFESLQTVDAMSTGRSLVPSSAAAATLPEDGAVPEAEATPGQDSGPDPGLLTRAALNADSERLARKAVRQHPSGRQGCAPALTADALGGPQRRRAVVLLTDGADRGSQRRFDEVLELARTTSIPIFPVMMGEARNDLQLREVLNALAGNTGGAIIETQSPEELEQAYRDVVVLLRASYLLGYLPEKDEPARRREIRVRSRRSSYRLVHRTWYYR